MIDGGLATIYVSDMDRAVKFYTEMLGLRLLYQAGPGWAQIDAGKGLTLGLHGAHEGGPQPGQKGSTVIGFELDEPMDQAYATLSERGVKFHGPVQDTEHVRLAYFSDTDGNNFYLSETK
ncbi:MAG TPA: VOC family protein [Chloroflexota bacterium]|nr:VOC family protein [Chloroflexota bacterium]